MSARIPDLAAAPKAELHCHIDGLLDAAMLRAIAGPGADSLAAELEACCPVDSVASWTERYGRLAEPHLVPAHERLPLLLEHQVRRWQAENVRYAEIFISRLLGTSDDHAELVDLFTRVRERTDAVAGSSIEVTFVVCVGRSEPGKLARQAAKISALWRAGLIAGVALAGDERRASVASLAPFFERFRGEGLGIEIHCGEHMGPESVWDALDHGHPHRLGHALSAFADPRALDAIGERGLHIEFCPTSNLCLGAVESIDAHPLGRAHQLGLSYSVNTDDPGPFGCSMTSELALVQRAFGLTLDDLEGVRLNAMAARFPP